LRFDELLQAINSDFKKNKKPLPKCFISYAWYQDGDKTKKLQSWLLEFKKYLEQAGADIFFDVKDMQLNMNNTMQQNIANSDYIFIIATPRLKERADEQTATTAPNNLQFELNHIFSTKQDHILPIIWEGDFKSSIPTKYTFSQNLCYDFSKNDSFIYYKLLIGATNPKGIIPVIFNIEYMNEYELLINEILPST